MTKYEPDKDKEVWVKKVDAERQTLMVQIMRYNNGEPKIQITRLSKDGFNKLGRLTAMEVQQLIPVLNEAVDAVLEEQILWKESREE